MNGSQDSLLELFFYLEDGWVGKETLEFIKNKS